MKVFLCNSEAGTWNICAESAEQIEKLSLGELQPFEEQTDEHEGALMDAPYRELHDLTTLDEWIHLYDRHHGIV